MILQIVYVIKIDKKTAKWVECSVTATCTHKICLKCLFNFLEMNITVFDVGLFQLNNVDDEQNTRNSSRWLEKPRVLLEMVNGYVNEIDILPRSSLQVASLWRVIIACQLHIQIESNYFECTWFSLSDR